MSVEESNWVPRIDRVEGRLDRVETRYEQAISSELTKLDRRVQHLEDEGVRLSEKVTDLLASISENTSMTREIHTDLIEHVMKENKDRVTLLGGIVLTLLSVFGTAVWSHILSAPIP